MTAAQRIPPAPPPTPPGNRGRAPMSPGTYLRKRREAAGVSVDRASLAMFPGNDRRVISDLVACADQVSAQIRLLESDEAHCTTAIAGCLARAFPFDPEIYEALIVLHFDGDVPIPHICRGCGCSFHQPCISLSANGAGIPCAWSDSDANICTACEARALQEQDAPDSNADAGQSGGPDAP